MVPVPPCSFLGAESEKENQRDGRIGDYRVLIHRCEELIRFINSIVLVLY